MMTSPNLINFPINRSGSLNFVATPNNHTIHQIPSIYFGIHHRINYPSTDLPVKLHKNNLPSPLTTTKGQESLRVCHQGTQIPFHSTISKCPERVLMTIIIHHPPFTLNPHLLGLSVFFVAMVEDCQLLPLPPPLLLL